MRRRKSIAFPFAHLVPGLVLHWLQFLFCLPVHLILPRSHWFSFVAIVYYDMIIRLWFLNVYSFFRWFLMDVANGTSYFVNRLQIVSEWIACICRNCTLVVLLLLFLFNFHFLHLVAVLVLVDLWMRVHETFICVFYFVSMPSDSNKFI